MMGVFEIRLRKLSILVISLIVSICCCNVRTVNGSLSVKYETQLGSSISIPIETSPPTRLINAPSWIAVSDHDQEVDGSPGEPSPPVVLLLKGIAKEVGHWTFDIADQVGVVSIQIHVREKASANDLPEGKASAVNLVKSESAAKSNVLEPSHDQVIIRRKRPRRTVIEGSAQHSISDGGDDEDYNDEDDDDEDYDDEDEGDDLLEERKVPIEPTPVLELPKSSSPPPEETSSTSVPIPIVVEITPTAVTQIQPQTSPIVMKADFIEFGSGFEPNTRVIEQLQPSFHKTHRNLEKLAIYNGKLFSYKIPEDIFTPLDTKIRYFIEPVGMNSEDSWIWVREDWIYSLPVDKDISDYNLTLVAERIDSGERANAQLIVSVRQRSKWRNYNHEIEVEWARRGSLSQDSERAKPAQDGASLIRDVLGGSWNDDDIIVRKVEIDGTNQKLFYTNETLVNQLQNNCPVAELEEIARKLKRRLDSVSIHFTGSLCEGYTPPTHQQQPIPPTTNFEPDVKNPIDDIPGIKGEFLVKQVPSHFCYDPEDGDTRQLKLSLVDENMQPLDDDNWLQFDEKNQEFYGLPGESGHYTLVCTDSGGKSANDALDVQIEPQPITSMDNYLTMNLHFQAPDFKPPTIRKFIARLAQAFNDSDISNIIVKSHQESTSGNQTNVHFSWINRTNPSYEYEASELRRIMLSNDGPPKREFVEFFRPEFLISVGELIPSKIMMGGGTFESENVNNAGIGIGGDDDVTKIPEWMDSSQYLITFVIPGILIFIMILLAVLIACLLSRQNNKSVANTKSGRPVTTNNAMLKKGVPVIFQDEYFDETEHHALHEPTSRSPAILRDEHPPLPPEYRRHNAPPSRSNMNIQSYQPPPGFNTRGNPPPRQHQNQGFGGRGRNPPPYVPP